MSEIPELASRLFIGFFALRVIGDWGRRFNLNGKNRMAIELHHKNSDGIRAL